MSDLTATEKLLMELFDVGAVSFDGPFKFKIHEKYPDFPLSPNKIILRTPENGGNLTPELVGAIAAEFKKKAAIASLMFDLVVGLPKAGEPFAEALARCSKKPLLKLAKETLPNSQRHIGRIISGEYQPGQKVLVLDDVVSEGETKIEGVSQIVDAGLRVVAIMVAFDREEGGSEYLQELGHRFFCIYEWPWVLKFYYRAGRISKDMLDESLTYSQLAKKFFFQNLA